MSQKLTITKAPQFIEAAYNRIVFEVSYSDYTLGDMFFLEVYDSITSKLLTTLVKNGTGLGLCEFDVSDIVQSLFPEPKVLNPNVVMQKDESALVSYQVKIGVVKLVNRVQVKSYHYISDVLYGLRAALSLDGSESVSSSLVVDYNREAKFLTSITPNQSESSDLFLPVLVTAPTEVKLVCNYYTSRRETEHTLPTLGVYVFNVRPSLQGSNASGLSVWLESETPTYLATATATVNCEQAGYIGSMTATATDFSTLTKPDALTKAMSKAASLAQANLVCVVDENAVQYTSTQSYTAHCSDGYTGSYTSTQTRTSFISQEDAYTKALNAAQADAQAKLVCTPAVTYTSTQTYTAYCPEGEQGSYTSTKQATSTISQADADAKAFAAAKAESEANLLCIPNEPNINPYLEGYQQGHIDAASYAPYRGGSCPMHIILTLEECEQWKAGYSDGWREAGGGAVEV
ncbi:hypothetical protein EFA69_06620 [Rufibacter immobilis]|uniref:DUF5977 domain-containing protein n=1 Tax=Rufibacter immobilis TaxID=1348778 RepID=A0A3M9MZM9_9BACT|nr:hypothetical protein [Rufibacter immobilis]RNI30960.1 hypothetical protein EFA69_06620 [Rufibacter immobilis]